ncbi:reverse transcriptase zinc-binding domain-containing protein [Tanacetum coccineum]
MSSDPNYQWEDLLDIDDSHLPLTPVLHPCKDLSGTLRGSIHKKLINEEGYGKEITVGSAIILANVFVFSPNPSMHYLHITKKNVIKVFYKDFVPGNDSGVGGSGMLMEEEIVKLVEEEEMADLELHVCGNVIDQEDL